ncbi:MAG: hypothetical protein KIS78_28395 [Labilithrix sp.]|nr:hypothetical protein [Labilithrix sp.]MCW5836353.1 hypothetical protein [Labilithrix sp.]
MIQARLHLAAVGCAAFALSLGCGGAVSPSQPGVVTGRTADGRAVEGDGRHRDLAAAKRASVELRRSLDEGEAEVKHAFDVALGKADPRKIGKKTPAADLVTFLRAKKFRVALGKGIQSNRQKFLLDREAKAEFNDGPGKGIPRKEHREIWGKFDELDMHLQEARVAMERTNQGLIKFNMLLMTSAAKIYADRHHTNLELDDTDYELLAELIAAQRRVEALAGLSTGLMTAYHVVIRENKDPKVLTSFAEETSKGFPTKGEASSADARAFVESLKRDLAGSKERYQGWVRDLWGEDEYSLYAKGIDDDFAKIEQLMAVEKGTSPDRPSAKASADALPIDGNAQTAFRGVVALATGDFKGAIGAASSLVPEGPLRKGLSILASLF